MAKPYLTVAVPVHEKEAEQRDSHLATHEPNSQELALAAKSRRLTVVILQPVYLSKRH